MDLTTTRTLACDLTDAEVNAYACEVAELCLEVRELEEEKAAHAKHIKGRIDGISADIADLSRKVKSRKEDRKVDCVWVYHWLNGVKQLERCDTRETVETRPIEPGERQGKLAVEPEPEVEGEEISEEPDPKANEHGVYMDHEVLVIHTKGTGAYADTIQVRLAEGSDGQWRAGYSFGIGGGNDRRDSSGMPSVRSTAYPTRADALRSMLEAALDWCKLETQAYDTAHVKRALRAIESIETSIADLEAHAGEAA